MDKAFLKLSAADFCFNTVLGLIAGSSYYFYPDEISVWYGPAFAWFLYAVPITKLFWTNSLKDFVTFVISIVQKTLGLALGFALLQPTFSEGAVLFGTIGSAYLISYGAMLTAVFLIMCDKA